jgi:hypothetical protein
LVRGGYIVASLPAMTLPGVKDLVGEGVTSGPSQSADLIQRIAVWSLQAARSWCPRTADGAF